MKVRVDDARWALKLASRSTGSLVTEGRLEAKPNFQRYGQMKKQRWEESEREKKKKKEDQRKKNQKKEDAGVRKSKVRNHCVSPMICGSAGLTSRLAKAAGAEPSGRRRDDQRTG